jgi:hypothetical protein
VPDAAGKARSPSDGAEASNRRGAWTEREWEAVLRQRGPSAKTAMEDSTAGDFPRGPAGRDWEGRHGDIPGNQAFVRPTTTPSIKPAKK